jgi:hypothetical protein
MKNVVLDRKLEANLRFKGGKIFHGKASIMILSVENSRRRI